MIRTVLIFAYITLVLLVSGLARAADLAQIEAVEFDSQTSMLHVMGRFTSSCQSHPRPIILATVQDQDQTIVHLGVHVEEPAGSLCAQVINGRYDLLVDIRSLDLPVYENLVLKFRNIAEGISLDPITTRIDRPAHGRNASSTKILGTLVAVPTVGMNIEPMFVVLGENGTATQVQSAIDLSFYLNNKVHVGGISLSNQVSPELETIDLGLENLAGQKLEKVFATEISLTPSK